MSLEDVLWLSVGDRGDSRGRERDPGDGLRSEPPDRDALLLGQVLGVAPAEDTACADRALERSRGRREPEIGAGEAVDAAEFSSGLMVISTSAARAESFGRLSPVRAGVGEPDELFSTLDVPRVEDLRSEAGCVRTRVVACALRRG